MSKISNCLKCLKLRSASGGSILLKEKIKECYIFRNRFLVFSLKIPCGYNIDGAKRRNNNFRHFRHFPV
jgi:hypothetical protein